MTRPSSEADYRTLGAQARRQLKSRSHNPYGSGLAHGWWDAGWDEEDKARGGHVEVAYELRGDEMAPRRKAPPAGED